LAVTYTITDTNVIAPGVGKVVTSGQHIVPGQFFRLEEDTGEAWLASNISGAEVARVVGMAIGEAWAGQPLHYVDSGEVEVGSVFGQSGRSLLLAYSQGKCMDSDLIMDIGEYLTFIGWSTAADKIWLAIYPSETLASLP
jgi:hypothetical protein